MRPLPCLIMCAAAARAHTMAPRRFTSSVSWKSSSVSSSSEASLRTPALLTRMSRRPHSSTTRSSVRSTAKASVMSLVKDSASPPPRAICSAVWVTPAASRSRSATCAPARASIRAVAAPMPRPAPVTTATRPSSDRTFGISGMSPKP